MSGWDVGSGRWVLRYHATSRDWERKRVGSGWRKTSFVRRRCRRETRWRERKRKAGGSRKWKQKTSGRRKRKGFPLQQPPHHVEKCVDNTTERLPPCHIGKCMNDREVITSKNFNQTHKEEDITFLLCGWLKFRGILPKQICSLKMWLEYVDLSFGRKTYFVGRVSEAHSHSPPNPISQQVLKHWTWLVATCLMSSNWQFLLQEDAQKWMWMLIFKSCRRWWPWWMGSYGQWAVTVNSICQTCLHHMRGPEEHHKCWWYMW